MQTVAKNSWRGIGVLWQCIKRWGTAVGYLDFKLTAWSSKKNRGCIHLLVSSSYHAVVLIFLKVIILWLMVLIATILVGTFSQNIQMSDEHSGGVKKRKGTDDCTALLNPSASSRMQVSFRCGISSRSNLNVLTNCIIILGLECG